MADQIPEKKPQRSTASGKAAAGKLSEQAKKAASTTKKVAEQTTARAARVGKKAQELGEGVRKRVKKDLSPAAEKAGQELKQVQKKLGEAFKATAKATRKSARILGIKTSILAENRKRQKLFAQLGESYYRLQKKKTPAKSDQEAVAALLKDLDQVNTQIRSLEAQEKVTRASQ